jgi:hypothetical protein
MSLIFSMTNVNIKKPIFSHVQRLFIRTEITDYTMGPFFNDCRVEISIFELDLYIDTIIIHVYYENWSSQTNFNNIGYSVIL